jgi:predicted GNAT family N-acyltransferase
VDVVEFGRLGDAQRAELEGDETDPFDERGTTLQWRPKDRHVALRSADGHLVASAGLVLVEMSIDDGEHVPVVGIGGVIVAAAHRGRGLARRVIHEALRLAATLGPEFALLFCHRDRVGLYVRHGFVEVQQPVLVAQPDGYVPVPEVTMWRAIRDGTTVPVGRVTVHSFPF